MALAIQNLSFHPPSHLNLLGTTAVATGSTGANIRRSASA
jgi:hypothetical protein